MKQNRVEEWNVRAASVLTAIMGFVNLFSGIVPALAERWRLIIEYSPLEVRRSGRLSAVIAGFALILLARNLWRRKRIAWFLTIITLIITMVSHIIKGLDYEEAILAGALLIWLLFLFPVFHAHSDPPSMGQGLKVLGYALGFTLIYGIAGFYILDRHFSVNFGFWAAFRQTLIMFAEFYDPGLQPMTRYGRYFADSIYTVGIVSIGYALIMVVRPVFVRHAAQDAERANAARIVEDYGRTSLARYTLFTDKLYYFTETGSFIAYVVKGRIAIALGDPVGPPDDLENAVSGFKQWCARNDWLPSFYQVQPDFLESYKRLGLNVLLIGHEAIVDLTEFKLEGNANKPIRTPINRLVRLGYQWQVHEPPLSDELMQQLRIISDEWLTMMHGTEKQFSLGWFDDEYIRNSRVIVVLSPEGSVTAFANLVPEFRRNELSLDLMRRVRNAESGTMEFLIANLFLWARGQGYQTFNLGLSALSGVGQKENDPFIERAMNFIYEHINRYYNFKGLHSFKEKFHPAWSPRYLIYPGPPSLPAVMSALIRADSGDDFWWRLFKLDQPDSGMKKPSNS